MRVAVVGAGPAGLYVSYLLKRDHPGATIDVFEQDPPGATFGFGVVLSDTALDFLKADDPETHGLITPAMEHWHDLTVVHRGERVTIDGMGFSAIGRLELLQLLRQRAESVGIQLTYRHRLDKVPEEDVYDLTIGADGVNSLIRQSNPQGFGSTQSFLTNRFIWYGTRQPFDTLTQTFVETTDGRFTAHHYRYAKDLSTFIVETSGQTWQAAGFEQMDDGETRTFCEQVFSATLSGAKLMSNNSHWRRFPVIRNARWSSGNRVLIGDALHTAHFSIGSGTRLAMEDAIALATALREYPDIADALADYQARRKPVLDKILAGADKSAAWYEAFSQHMDLDPYEFAMNYIGRSGRVDPARLERMAPGFMAQYRRRTA